MNKLLKFNLIFLPLLALVLVGVAAIAHKLLQNNAQKQVVQIAAGTIELRGLGLRQIADLLVRFPELRKLMVEGAPAIDVDTMLAGAPDAINAFDGDLPSERTESLLPV